MLIENDVATSDAVEKEELQKMLDNIRQSNRNYPQVGWICPVCGAGVAPWQPYCCKNVYVTCMY